jgi:hypothetical protein
MHATPPAARTAAIAAGGSGPNFAVTKSTNMMKAIACINVKTSPPIVDLAASVQNAAEQTGMIIHITKGTAERALSGRRSGQANKYTRVALRTAPAKTSHFSIQILFRSTGWLSNSGRVRYWNSLPSDRAARRVGPAKNPNIENLKE